MQMRALCFRNCGKVFCGRCSGNTIPLPQFNMHRPVRVCNRCNVLCQFPEVVVDASAEADLGSPTSGGGGVEAGLGGLALDDEDVDEDGGRSPGGGGGEPRNSWGSRNLGMIS